MGPLTLTDEFSRQMHQQICRPWREAPPCIYLTISSQSLFSRPVCSPALEPLPLRLHNSPSFILFFFPFKSHMLPLGETYILYPLTSIFTARLLYLSANLLFVSPFCSYFSSQADLQVVDCVIYQIVSQTAYWEKKIKSILIWYTAKFSFLIHVDGSVLLQVSLRIWLQSSVCFGFKVLIC